MKHSEFYNSDILIRYFGKETNAEENKMVEDWCEESAQHMDHFLKIKELWDDTADHSVLHDKYQAKYAFERLFSKNGKIFKIRIPNIKQLAVASITLLICLGLGIAYHLWHNREFRFTSDQQVSDIVLKDNTKIWLNRNSTISYIKNNRKERVFRLSGEAYFEVFPDSKRPFVVLTGNSKIIVVGTKFNVRAYPDLSETEVAVTSGVVEISHLSGTPSKQNDLRLTAGEKGIIKNTDISPVKETIEDMNYISWKTRDFVFNSTNLIEIVNLANSIYNVNIEIQSDNVEYCNLTGNFSCQSIEEMLEMLEFVLNITVERQGDKIYIKSDSCLVHEQDD